MKSSAKKRTFWPYAIILAFVLFGAYILNFVRLAMKQDVGLVSKDYYQQEVAYQQHIDKVSRTEGLSSEIKLTHIPEADQLTVLFPEEFAGKKVEGKINFFRPSNDKLDFELPLELNNGQVQVVNTKGLQRGYWRVKIYSEAEGQEYYAEQVLNLK